MRTDPARLLRLCAAGPPAALLAFVTWTMAADAAGEHPFWHGATLNMAEAAAARDLGTVALLLERGEDPNRPHPIRPPLLDSPGVELTPFEAAATAGRLEIVDLLVTRGASVDPERRLALACAALRRGYTDVAAYLSGSAGITGIPGCE